MSQVFMNNLRPQNTRYRLLETDSKPLDSIVCDFVILSASPRKVTDDSLIAPDANGTYKSDGNEVCWGIAPSEAAHPLYIGESTPLIPVENASQIVVKCFNPEAGQVVIYTTFIEQQEQI